MVSRRCFSLEIPTTNVDPLDGGAGGVLPKSLWVAAKSRLRILARSLRCCSEGFCEACSCCLDSAATLVDANDTNPFSARISKPPMDLILVLAVTCGGRDWQVLKISNALSDSCRRRRVGCWACSGACCCGGTRRPALCRSLVRLFAVFPLLLLFVSSFCAVGLRNNTYIKSVTSARKRVEKLAKDSSSSSGIGEAAAASAIVYVNC